MKLLLIIFYFLTTKNVQALEIWATPDRLVSKDSHDKIIQNVTEKLKEHEVHSYFDILLNQPMPQAKLKSIFQKQYDAEQAYMHGEFAESLSLFQNILDGLKQWPNVRGVEKIRHHVYIRMAEISELLKKENRWAQTFAWAPKAIFSPSEYSPDVIRKIHTAKNKLKKVKTTIKAPENAYVFIDGEKQTSVLDTYSATLYEGEHQIAMLVPGASWVIQNITLKSTGKNVIITMKASPLAQGSCESPKFSNSLPKNTRLLVHFIDQDCERIFDGKAWYSLDEKPVSVVGSSAFNMPTLNEPTKKSWFDRAKTSPWFWIGATAVVAGTVYFVKQSQERETVVVPTNR